VLSQALAAAKPIPCAKEGLAQGGEHHAHSTLARRRQPAAGRVAGPVTVRPRLRRGGRLDNRRAWLCVILFAVEGFIIPSYLEEWGEILLGLALLVAPWTIGYEPALATTNSVVSGLVVILFAVWELATIATSPHGGAINWHRTTN